MPQTTKRGFPQRSSKRKKRKDSTIVDETNKRLKCTEKFQSASSTSYKITPTKKQVPPPTNSINSNAPLSLLHNQKQDFKEPKTQLSKRKNMTDKNFLRMLTEEIHNALTMFDNTNTIPLKSVDIHNNFKYRSDSFKGAVEYLNLKTGEQTKGVKEVEIMAKEFKSVFEGKDNIKNILQVRNQILSPENSIPITDAEILHAKWCLYPLLHLPTAFERIPSNATKLELVNRFFGSLGNISDLFRNTSTNAGSQLSATFKDMSVNMRAAQLIPDRQVLFLIEKTNTQVVRVLQVDQSDNIYNHQNHKHDMNMLVLLKVCHAKLMKEILVQDPTKEHLDLFNEIYTYGFLSAKNMVEIIGVRCQVNYCKNSGYLLEYHLDHFGKFQFNNGDDKFHKHVVHDLLGNVLAIYSICEKQHYQINSILNTKNITDTVQIPNDQQLSIEQYSEITIACETGDTCDGIVQSVTNTDDGKILARVQLHSGEVVFIKHCAKITITKFIFKVLVQNTPCEFSFAGQCLDRFWNTDTHLLTYFDGLITFFCQLLYEVDSIHAKQWIHNDIKLGNIVIYNQYPKLIDFEICKKFDHYDENEEKCFLNEHVITSKAGTPATMPPEKESTGEITPKSDVYSLGMVFRELLFKFSQNTELTKQQSVLKELIGCMIKEEKKERPTIDECLQFFSKHFPQVHLRTIETHSQEIDNLVYSKFYKLFARKKYFAGNQH